MKNQRFFTIFEGKVVKTGLNPDVFYNLIYTHMDTKPQQSTGLLGPFGSSPRMLHHSRKGWRMPYARESLTRGGSVVGRHALKHCGPDRGPASAPAACPLAAHRARSPNPFRVLAPYIRFDSNTKGRLIPSFALWWSIRGSNP